MLKILSFPNKKMNLLFGTVLDRVASSKYVYNREDHDCFSPPNYVDMTCVFLCAGTELVGKLH